MMHVYTSRMRPHQTVTTQYQITTRSCVVLTSAHDKLVSDDDAASLDHDALVSDHVVLVLDHDELASNYIASYQAMTR